MFKENIIKTKNKFKKLLKTSPKLFIFIFVFAIVGTISLIITRAETTLITFIPQQINENIANPGMGWQARSDTTFLPEKVTYSRWSGGWAQFNPSNGTYDWTTLDTALTQAKQQGKQLSFRIYTMRGESYGGHKVPLWAVNSGVTILSSGEPDYADPEYLKFWGTFVEALRSRYDGNTDIAFMDISGYGNFNEWSWQTQTEWDSDYNQPTTRDGLARKQLADMWLGGSSTTYNYPGFQKTQIVMPYAGIRQSLWYVMDKRPDVGWRYDCLGRMTTTDLDKLGAKALSRWQTAPVAFEFCGISSWTSTIETNTRDVLRRSHGTLVHDNDVPKSTNLSTLIRPVGYRYILEEATYPATTTLGSSFKLDMKWKNTGNALPYKKMGQDLEVRASLHNQSGALLKEWPVSADISLWQPLDSSTGTSPSNVISANISLPSTITAGTYELRIGMFEKRTNAPITLAISNRLSDGRYRMGVFSVSSDSTTPVTPPPPPPTTTDTLAPTAVTNILATNISANSVSFVWNASTDNVGVDRYEIWRGDSRYRNWALVGTVDKNTLSFNDINLSRRTTYTYDVRALDLANNKSASSSILKVTTLRK